MVDGPVRAWLCWCGEGDLEGFSDRYDRCPRCRSLVARVSAAPAAVRDERADLYGLNYFLEHARELGHPDLYTRSRSDLSERCVSWLRSLLRRRPPPARVLELGCANGAFVGLLATAGYEATGLDLSPTITAYVAETFGVQVLTGPLEVQRLRAGGVDVLVMMDVLEHLPDPVATLEEVGRVLAPDGLVLVQTPDCPPDLTHQEMVAGDHAFLRQLKPQEHLFLLSQAGVRDLFRRAGFVHLEHEPAVFAEYDQCFVASRQPLQVRTDGLAALERSRGGRLVEALLDACERSAKLEAGGRTQQRLVDAMRTDHAGLLEAVGELRRRLEEAERGRVEQLGLVDGLRCQVEEIEKDRAARLDFIHQQQRQIDEIERDRAVQADSTVQQRRRVEELERDQAASSSLVEQQRGRIEDLDDARIALQEENQRLRRIEAAYGVVLRRLGPLRHLLGYRATETKS